jgi:hypothetical protein
VTEEQRSRAKAVNFGLMYGQGAFGLSQQLGISTREAEEYIEGYFSHFASVRRYFEKTLGEARRQGYVTTLMSRRRYLPEIGSENRQVRSAAERMAVNTTIQGTAADLIKVAMPRSGAAGSSAWDASHHAGPRRAGPRSAEADLTGCGSSCERRWSASSPCAFRSGWTFGRGSTGARPTRISLGNSAIITA